MLQKSMGRLGMAARAGMARTCPRLGGKNGVDLLSGQTITGSFFRLFAGQSKPKPQQVAWGMVKKPHGYGGDGFWMDIHVAAGHGANPKALPICLSLA